MRSFGLVAAAVTYCVVQLLFAHSAVAADETLKEKAARRFPQPVRVGDLGTRLVTEPSNHETVLGRTAGVVRLPNGDIEILLRYGGFLGLGTRLIAVPVEATGILGQFLEVLDLDQKQLDALPDWKPDEGVRLADNETIRIGLTKN
jgi:hypothetical protein